VSVTGSVSVLRPGHAPGNGRGIGDVTVMVTGTGLTPRSFRQQAKELR
jgi:hypothetical protein